MESDPTIVQVDIKEKIFYEKVNEYIQSLGEKFREKSIIKQEIYNNIQKCLSLPKGTSSDSYSAGFV